MMRLVMHFLYNTLQLLFLIFFWPLIGLAVVAKPKYRNRIPGRLGWGLRSIVQSPMHGKKTIWVHALSVGEVTSALPLVRGIRQTMDVNLIFSVTTATGAQLAEKTIAPHVDRIVPFPVDILPVVDYFLGMMKPDLFILIETDFWPNLLTILHRKRIPSLLVNGRISRKSMHSYRRFGFFFRPLFLSFSALSMQTAVDRENMIDMGVPEERVLSLGNLKFDTSSLQGEKPVAVNLPSGIRIVAGSTHRGEEGALLRAYSALKPHWQDLSLVIAPRDICRGKEIQGLAGSLGLTAALWTQGLRSALSDLLILDTIGELVGYYQTCDIAYVGGSLVEQGGHNPIEPAAVGVPVLFGPHMEDFAEIADDLLAAGGAIRVHDADSLLRSLESLVGDPGLRREKGIRASSFIKEKQGVISKHVELIRKFL
jgi:3-deoxy-D-manno-octulosonic-acid transferase